MERYWTLFVAAIIAAIGMLALPYDVLDPVTTEIVAFLSIQSAAAMTAMVFTAGLFRPDGLSVQQANHLRTSLRRVLRFWISILGWDVAAIVALIVGKIGGWSWKIGYSPFEPPLDLSFILFGTVLLLTSWAATRMVPFCRAILGLFDDNAELVEEEVKANSEAENAETFGKVKPFRPPEGYGKVINGD